VKAQLAHRPESRASDSVIEGRTLKRFSLLFNAISATLIAPNSVIGWLPADAGNQYSIRAQLQFGFYELEAYLPDVW